MFARLVNLRCEGILLFLFLILVVIGGLVSFVLSPSLGLTLVQVNALVP